MKIGIIVATKEERQAFHEVFSKYQCPCKQSAKEYEIEPWFIGDINVYLLLSGIGEIAATASTQFLIDQYRVDKIINYGVAGSLTPNLKTFEVGIVSKIVHYDFVTSKNNVGRYPNTKSKFQTPNEDAIPSSFTTNFPKFICASGDKFVEARDKEKYHSEFNADICEMESAGILMTCNRNNVPVSFIKSISDGIDEDIEAFNNNVYQAALNCANILHDYIVSIA